MNMYIDRQHLSRKEREEEIKVEIRNYFKSLSPSRDGFVNLNISLNSIDSFGSLAHLGLTLLFCFSLIRRSLSIVTSWS